jgi:hypothetical protein
MSFRIFSVIVMSFCLLAGCATMKHGTKQTIPVGSEPMGAKVYVDGEYMGTTPMQVKLKRSKMHRIGVFMAGHEMGLFELTPKLSADVWYNAILMPGVFAGFLIDSLTGGLYELSLEQIEHQLVKKVTVPQVQYN